MSLCAVQDALLWPSAAAALRCQVCRQCPVDCSIVPVQCMACEYRRSHMCMAFATLTSSACNAEKGLKRFFLTTQAHCVQALWPTRVQASICARSLMPTASGAI